KLSGVFEKSKNLNLPTLDTKKLKLPAIDVKNLKLPLIDKKEPSQQTASEPAAEVPKPVAKKPASPNNPAAKGAADPKPTKKLKLPLLGGKKQPNQQKAVAPKPVAVAPKKPAAPVPRLPVIPIQVIDGQVQVRIAPEDKAKTLAAKYLDAVADNMIAECRNDSASIENSDVIIEAAYKQVFGNAHIMESERSREAESQMRSGEISVLEFIRQLAKSDRYRALFFDNCPNVSAIELNFKHLLGRAPESYEEICQHLKILAEEGFEAEIDSYLDSDEYLQNFGDIQVPYPRGYNTQTGRTAIGFTRSFPLFGAACSSDRSMCVAAIPELKPNLLQGSPGSIPSLRAIPDSYPQDVTVGPPPRVPTDLKLMARDLLKEFESRKTYRPSLF
ncbi:MAG: phycobilisome rod-core linker polypeptide, partial [Cyanobacteria bacterium P01_F01_bin.3]